MGVSIRQHAIQTWIDVEVWANVLMSPIYVNLITHIDREVSTNRHHNSFLSVVKGDIEWYLKTLSKHQAVLLAAGTSMKSSLFWVSLDY